MILFLVTLVLVCSLIPLGLHCHRLIGEIGAGENARKAGRELRICGACMGAAVLLAWMLSFYAVGQINGNPHESWLATQEAQEREILGHIIGAREWETPPSYRGSAPWAVDGAWRNSLIRQREHRD